MQPVLVNRGWIPKDFKETKHHWAGFTGDIKIIGVLYKGDNSFKYSQDNDIKNEKWNNSNPEFIAAYLRLKNRDVSSKFIVRQIEYDVTTKTPFPRIFNVGEATNWQVSVDNHNQVAKVWKYATYLNVFSNLFFWLYL
jgi:cytochrome oxidase assembly protein ShyY1